MSQRPGRRRVRIELQNRLPASPVRNGEPLSRALVRDPFRTAVRPPDRPDNPRDSWGSAADSPALGREGGC